MSISTHLTLTHEPTHWVAALVLLGWAVVAGRAVGLPVTARRPEGSPRSWADRIGPTSLGLLVATVIALFLPLTGAWWVTPALLLAGFIAGHLWGMTRDRAVTTA
ncbi:hypothetical protein SAMN05445756_2187 [Kytococcus aerolatus]|uniref:Uncharacterized protein n=1 Tax=Kytococcus aerolatus TaxID=592308 RepID=A0A212U7Q1_9MICO|nr:hypothetical protein SAMN05445756_2187 [Kytococcus aerolatus]